MDNAEVIEHFYGVYLLYCVNPKFAGQTYIGFTVDPNRRIKQHNKGSKFGGAWKTSGRGPWKMVLIIHGFPNDISALRFEWAWQHPQFSRRLKHISRKKLREKKYDYCLRILSEMLLVGPWNRLPLTVRWLEEEFAHNFPVDKLPPIHMPICYGPVKSKKISKNDEIHNDIANKLDLECFLCMRIIENGRKLTCLSSSCGMVSHIICLSNEFLTDGEYVPVEGLCPKCKTNYLWGDIVRKYKGCYRELNNDHDSDSDY